MGRKGTRVLLKKPPGKEVQSTDTFAWNKAFTSDRIKFRINQIQQDMSAEESKKTNEQVIIDRVSVLEATIVRIMKGKKKMTLQLLIDAVVSDVSKRFPPDVKEMKKRVESLIEREVSLADPAQLLIRDASRALMKSLVLDTRRRRSKSVALPCLALLFPRCMYTEWMHMYQVSVM